MSEIILEGSGRHTLFRPYIKRDQNGRFKSHMSRQDRSSLLMGFGFIMIIVGGAILLIAHVAASCTGGAL